MKKKRKMSTEAFDKAFDEGQDVTAHLDLNKAKMSYPVQRINIDIPKSILDKVDREAERVGVPRTSLLKVWIAEQADRLAG